MLLTFSESTAWPVHCIIEDLESFWGLSISQA